MNEHEYHLIIRDTKLMLNIISDFKKYYEIEIKRTNNETDIIDHDTIIKTEGRKSSYKTDLIIAATIGLYQYSRYGNVLFQANYYDCFTYEYLQSLYDMNKHLIPTQNIVYPSGKYKGIRDYKLIGVHNITKLMFFMQQIADSLPEEALMLLQLNPTTYRRLCRAGICTIKELNDIDLQSVKQLGKKGIENITDCLSQYPMRKKDYENDVAMVLKGIGEHQK